MVRVREKFLQQITLLAKDGYGTVDASMARIINVADPIDSNDLANKDYVDSLGQTKLTTIANLRSLTYNPLLVHVTRYAAVGTEGGGGDFEYVSGDSTTPDDGGVWFINAVGGRYRRITNEVTLDHFGADPNYNPVTSTGGDSSAALAAFKTWSNADPANRPMLLGRGTYLITTGITISGHNYTIEGVPGQTRVWCAIPGGVAITFSGTCQGITVRNIWFTGGASCGLAAIQVTGQLYYPNIFIDVTGGFTYTLYSAGVYPAGSYQWGEVEVNTLRHEVTGLSDRWPTNGISIAGYVNATKIKTHAYGMTGTALYLSSSYAGGNYCEVTGTTQGCGRGFEIVGSTMTKFRDWWDEANTNPSIITNCNGLLFQVGGAIINITGSSKLTFEKWIGSITQDSLCFDNDFNRAAGETVGRTPITRTNMSGIAVGSFECPSVSSRNAVAGFGHSDPVNLCLNGAFERFIAGLTSLNVSGWTGYYSGTKCGVGQSDTTTSEYSSSCCKFVRDPGEGVNWAANYTTPPLPPGLLGCTVTFSYKAKRSTGTSDLIADITYGGNGGAGHGDLGGSINCLDGWTYHQMTATVNADMITNGILFAFRGYDAAWYISEVTCAVGYVAPRMFQRASTSVWFPGAILNEDGTLTSTSQTTNDIFGSAWQVGDQIHTLTGTLTCSVAGSPGTWVESSQIRLDTIAQLIALTYNPKLVYVTRYAAAGTEAGGGQFEYIPGDTTTPDDGGIYFVNAIGGRYRRIGSEVGPINVAWFGIVGDGTTDWTVQLQALFNSLPVGRELYLPRGLYRITDTLHVRNAPNGGFIFKGEGCIDPNPNNKSTTLIADFATQSGTAATISSIVNHNPVLDPYSKVVTLTGLTGIASAQPGDTIKISNAAEECNNGYFTIMSVYPDDGYVTFLGFNMYAHAVRYEWFPVLPESNNGSLHWEIRKPMISVYTRDISFDTIFLDGNSTCGACVDSTNTGSGGVPSGSVVNTNVRFVNCRMVRGFTGVKIGDFSGYATGGCTEVNWTNNCDFHYFDKCSITLMDYASICIPNATSNSLQHTIKDTSLQYTQYGIAIRRGSFIGYNVNFTSNTGADILNLGPSDPCTLWGGGSEHSARFLVLGVSGYMTASPVPIPFTAIGVRTGTSNAELPADKCFMQISSLGSVSFKNCQFFYGNEMTFGTQGYHPYENKRQVSMTFEGCSFACATPNDIVTAMAGPFNHKVWYSCLSCTTRNGADVPTQVPNGILEAIGPAGTTETAFPLFQIGQLGTPAISTSSLLVDGYNNSVTNPYRTSVTVTGPTDDVILNGITAGENGQRLELRLSYNQITTINHLSSLASAGRRIITPDTNTLSLWAPGLNGYNVLNLEYDTTEDSGNGAWVVKNYFIGNPREITINNIPISDIVLDKNLSATIVNGIATIKSYNVPNVYGNYDVARRLINSLTAEKKVTLIQLGDSRAVDQANLQLMMTYGFGIPWGGFSVTPNGLVAGGAPWTTTIYDPTAATPVSCPIDTYIGRIAPLSVRQTLFSNGTSPSWSNSRFEYASPTTNTLYALRPQLDGYNGRAIYSLRHGSYGVMNNYIRFSIRGNSTTYAGSTPYFSNYAVSESTISHIATIPSDWDWDTHTITNLEAEYLPGATTIANEAVYSLNPVILESEIGVTLCNLSVGGRTPAAFLNDDIFSDTLWTSFFTNLSGEKILWLSLGTNGEPHATATLVLQLQQLITDFRTLQPNGYVLMDNAYLGATELGYSATRRAAIMEVVNNDERILLLDTCAEMGPYTSQYIRGLYGSPGDGVHYISNPGIREYVATICSMIARAAEV